jgi:head-tail adaptor
MATRGQKRHRLTLENPGAKVPDGDGGFTQTWAALSPPMVYAEIKPATARDLERVVSNVVQSTASHIVTCDYHSGITSQTRVSWTGPRDGRAHVGVVTGVQDPEERNVELVLAVEEVVT